MSGTLVRISFKAELLPKVQNFDCGTEAWEREVSDWIKTPEGAIEALADGTAVWLYATEEGDLVGSDPLGKPRNDGPNRKTPR